MLIYHRQDSPGRVSWLTRSLEEEESEGIMKEKKFNMEENYEEFMQFFRSEIVARVCVDECSDKHDLINAFYAVLPEVFMKFLGVDEEDVWASQLIEDLTGDEGVLFYLNATKSEFNNIGEIVDR